MGSKPALSLVVPSPLRRDSVPYIALDTASSQSLKQKRLFPVACRVVPTDQWFTSRIDRTWTVLDLKLWLLSKALPAHALPLPAAFRPSSPVTFAAAPPRPQTATSYRPLSTPPPIPLPPSPPRSRTASPIPSALVSEDDTLVSQVIEVDAVESDTDSLSDPFDLDLDIDDPIHTPPRSIPYSFSTGAPSISGLSALQHKARGFTPSVDPALLTLAQSTAPRWRVVSFSTGLVLADDLPLAEYSLVPWQLLELHRAGGYVSLPRSVVPHPLSRKVDDDSEDDSDEGVTARVHGVPSRREPSPQDGSEEEEEVGQSGTSYTAPYFDGWACVLNNPRAQALEDQENIKTRKRERARSDARAAKGKDREKEWSELQKLLGAEVTSPLPEQVERWRRRWVVVSKGVISVWRDKRDARPEMEWDVAQCVGLHDAEKIPDILGSTLASTQMTPAQKDAHRTQPILCARFRTPPRRKGSKHQRITPTASSPWLVLKLQDPATREHLLRTLHRLAYTSHPSHPSHTHTPHPRTLRTDFLPNPIPHPLALSFSQPAHDSSEDLELSPVFSPSVSEAESDEEREAEKEWVGLGPGMGVRFPEWREYVLRRAVRAGQGFPAPCTPPSSAGDPYGFGPGERPYLGGGAAEDDGGSDADSDAMSEKEWEGWAYDLDRPRGEYSPKGVTGKGGGMKTPHGSPVEVEVHVQVDFSGSAGRRRAQSFAQGGGYVDSASPTPNPTPPTLSPPLSPPLSASHSRMRAATVSSASSPDDTTSVHTRMYDGGGSGRMRGLMRGLSMRAGRESFMRSLENALDFVEGK